MHMKKSFAAILMAGSLSLGACATTDPYADDTLAGAGTGAAIGAVAGAGAGAVIGGLSPIEGAAIGAAVGGLAGAVWADSNNDGYADGYYQNGQYYEGRPAGYNASASRSCPTTLGGAATGAAIGAAGGAGVGAVVGGINPLEGAAIGAVVGGLAGAVWADRNNDGCVDGYYRSGQYYEGAPQPQQYQSAPVYRAGERG
jgi:phage tail tape-measure protein